MLQYISKMFPQNLRCVEGGLIIGEPYLSVVSFTEFGSFVHCLVVELVCRRSQDSTCKDIFLLQAPSSFLCFLAAML